MKTDYVLPSVNDIETKKENGYVLEFMTTVKVLKQYVAFGKAIKNIRFYLPYVHFIQRDNHMRMFITDMHVILTQQLAHATYCQDTINEYFDKTNTRTFYVSCADIEKHIKELKPNDTVFIKVTKNNELSINRTICKDEHENSFFDITKPFKDIRAKDLKIKQAYINPEYMSTFLKFCKAINNETDGKNIITFAHEDKQMNFVHSCEGKIQANGLMMMAMSYLVNENEAKERINLRLN